MYLLYLFVCAYKAAWYLRSIALTRCWKILRDFAPYLQLLQIYQHHIHDENHLFYQIPKVRYWIETRWLWRPFEYSKLIVMFKNQVWEYQRFVIWRAILLEAVIRRYSGQNCQVGCCVYVYFQWPRKYPLHQYTTNNCWYKAEWVHAFSFQILTLPSECRSTNRNSSDQATLFQFCIVQFWWAHLNCRLILHRV